MPTIFTHPAVPIAMALGVKRKIPGRLLAAGIIGSMVPDLDVLGMRLGISHASEFGHRGFTHSLLFAAVLALIGAMFHRRLRAGFWFCFLFLFAAVASHGVLDAFTNGGGGIAFLWPWSGERYFAPFRPIEVSPLGIRGFFTARGAEVLKSEFLWIWLPLLATAAAFFVARRRKSTR